MTGLRRALVLLTALSLVAALSACNGGGGGSGTPKPADQGGGTRVTYEAEDGLRIVADFYPPKGGGPAAAVLLLHQSGGSRAQWADLIPDILDWGYAVLAPDLRGHGESTVLVRNGKEEEYQLEDLNALVLDVAAAIDYLKSRSEVDASSIGVVGASVGGNVAYVASGAFLEVRATVSMSPNAHPQGNALLGADVPDFNPQAVLFLSDEAEAPDAKALAENVKDPVEVHVYEGKTAHGVELLLDSRARPDIRGWLTVNLRLSR